MANIARRRVGDSKLNFKRSCKINELLLIIIKKKKQIIIIKKVRKIFFKLIFSHIRIIFFSVYVYN